MRRFHLRAGELVSTLPIRVLTLVLLVVVMFANTMKAADPAEERFFLNADGSVEKRLASQEKKTADLEKRIADLEAKLKTNATTAKVGPVNPNWKDAPAATSGKVTFSMCSNGKCYTYQQDASIPVPFGAKVLSVTPPASAASSVTAGDTGPCACGPDCQCVSCVNTVSASTFTTSGASSSDGGRWFLGKNLGRNRAGRGCSSCGQ